MSRQSLPRSQRFPRNGEGRRGGGEEEARAAELWLGSEAELRNPPCDFDFGSFYKEWYRKARPAFQTSVRPSGLGPDLLPQDGYVGPCGPPNANCKGRGSSEAGSIRKPRFTLASGSSAGGIGFIRHEGCDSYSRATGMDARAF